MNEHEINELTFEQTLKRFGHPAESPSPGDIVLAVQYCGSFKVGEAIEGQHSVLVCRVKKVDDEKEEVVVEKIVSVPPRPC